MYLVPIDVYGIAPAVLCLTIPSHLCKWLHVATLLCYMLRVILEWHFTKRTHRFRLLYLP